MTNARNIMHAGAECIPEGETLDRAAQLMRNHSVGSLPVCGDDDRLKGIITDRDIVVKCIAGGHDPATMTAAQLCSGELFWVDADADAAEVLQLMERNHIRRLPVMEGHRLVGMISEADLATHLSPQQVAEFASAIYSAPSGL
jgi:CBS domain-containing protein